MVTRLDQEVAEVDKNIDLLKKKDEELSSALEKMESQSENNDIDEHVRLLSRKQFQLRALMQKARKTAGLSDLY
ncbi:hypothetical protein E2320_020823 [Naja naja]|nr:hypothetical protein E2320_020823 [Naja naja]